MESSKTDNRSAFVQAINRRDGAMRDMHGIGSDPVGHTQDKPQVGIWKIAGNRDRPRAGCGLTQSQTALKLEKAIPRDVIRPRFLVCGCSCCRPWLSATGSCH